MTRKWDQWLRQPLLAERPVADDRRARWILLLLWFVATLTLVVHHVPWRDEVRAWSLMLQGDSWPGMFRAVQGEGHPYLWYILLRAGHLLFGVKEVLPALGLLVATAAAALLALRAPFRLALIAVLLFSLHLGFAYSVVSRNYGISALVMFIIAANYQRVKNTPLLGVLLLLLCNTNAPSVLLAGALLLYRMVEVAAERPSLRSREVRMILVNGLLLLLGALFCFLAVYPPVNDAAAAVNKVPLTSITAVQSVVDADRSFGALGFDNMLWAANLFILISLGVFVRSRPAMVAALVAFVVLKLFFFFVFPAAYRHAALFLMFLVALLWIEGDRRLRAGAREPVFSGLFGLASAWAFALLLAMQSILYVKEPVLAAIQGRPYSSAGELAQILARPEFAGASLMFDPDALGESVVYHTGQPYWLLRQGRFGTITPFTMAGNKELSLDDFLATADRLHRSTKRPVIIVLQRDIERTRPGRYDVMYADFTLYTPENIARFLQRTRPVARLDRAYGDENYLVYAYPR